MSESQKNPQEGNYENKTMLFYKVSVVMIKQVFHRGKFRQKLATEGRTQSLRVTRCMGTEEVREKLRAECGV